MPIDEAPARRAPDERASVFARRFGEALRVGDARLAEEVAEEALTAGLDAAAVHVRVVAPAMRWIGDLWERGALTVADEHLATAVSHDVLARLFPHLLTAEPRSRARVLLAAAQGEHHVLGLRSVADILEGAGYDVLYLGPDVPRDALLAACARHRPAVVGLSASMALNVPTLLAQLDEVHGLDRPPRLIAGGRALSRAVPPGLHAPVVADADRVPAAVERLLADGASAEPLDDALRARIPRDPLPGPVGDAGIGTVPDAFSATALAAADTARAASRRAFALEQLALRDPLTGLWNRRAFDDRFGDLADDGAELVLLMVDVDRFKAVNDTLGHDAGDATLLAVAGSIAAGVRPGDFVVRYGGDEFAVLLPGIGVEEAGEIGERVRAGVAEALAAQGVTVSIGLAAYGGDRRLTGVTVDRALYEAKAGGRNRVAVAGA